MNKSLIFAEIILVLLIGIIGVTNVIVYFDTNKIVQSELLPYVGENGNWWIGDKDTEISSKGTQGEPGEQGEQGVPGEDGKTTGTDNIFYKGKKYVSYGDSLTIAGTWPSIVAAHFGMNLTRIAQGGARMAYDGRQDNRSLSDDIRLQSAIDLNPDVMTIWAGANDISHSNFADDNELEKPINEKDITTYIGAYSSVIERLLTWKPSLKILIIMQQGFQNVSEQAMSVLRNQTLDVINRYNLPYIDGEDIGINEFNLYELTTDGLHMKSPAQNAVAALVIDALNKLGYAV